MNWNTETKAYYFPDKDRAESFRKAIKTCPAIRLVGRVSLRKTLAERAHGKTRIRDTRHADGYTVRARGLSFADEIELASRWRQNGGIAAPHSTGGVS